MPSRKAYRKMSKSPKNAKAMKGGNCGAGSAHGYTGSIVPMAAQETQLNSMFSTTDVGGPNAQTLAPFQSKFGGAKRMKGKGRSGKKGLRKVGGYGFEMLVPAALLAANQLYRPKGKTASFRKSRKNRTMRRR